MGGRRAEEVAGKSEANQVHEKVVEGRAAQSISDRVRDDASADRVQITHESSGKFHFDLARFVRAALAPSLPKAVRVFRGRGATVRSRRAARTAFVIVRFAATRCHKFRNQIYRDRIFRAPQVTLCLSGDAFVCALLSSRRPNASVPSVALPPASRVSTMPALMLSDGSHA